MKELLQYSEHDAFRDAVNEDGDVIPISDLRQSEIDELAVQLGRDLGAQPRAETTVYHRQPVDSSIYHGPQYGEEEGVGYSNGEPHYYEPVRWLSPEELERHARGIAMARRTLEEIRNPSH